MLCARTRLPSLTWCRAAPPAEHLYAVAPASGCWWALWRCRPDQQTGPSRCSARPPPVRTPPPSDSFSGWRPRCGWRRSSRWTKFRTVAQACLTGPKRANHNLDSSSSEVIRWHFSPELSWGCAIRFFTCRSAIMAPASKLLGDMLIQNTAGNFSCIFQKMRVVSIICGENVISAT